MQPIQLNVASVGVKFLNHAPKWIQLIYLNISAYCCQVLDMFCFFLCKLALIQDQISVKHKNRYSLVHRSWTYMYTIAMVHFFFLSILFFSVPTPIWAWIFCWRFFHWWNLEVINNLHTTAQWLYILKKNDNSKDSMLYCYLFLCKLPQQILVLCGIGNVC